jgi:hypothetical protein
MRVEPTGSIDTFIGVDVVTGEVGVGADVYVVTGEVDVGVDVYVVTGEFDVGADVDVDFGSAGFALYGITHSAVLLATILFAPPVLLLVCGLYALWAQADFDFFLPDTPLLWVPCAPSVPPHEVPREVSGMFTSPLHH